jgi:hypothetical protein
LGNVGLRGIVDPLDVTMAKTVLEVREVDLWAANEHFRGKGERVRNQLDLQATEEERLDVEGLLGEEWQWVERCRLKGGRGGVGLAVRRSAGVATVLEEWCSEAMLWVKVDLVGGGVVFVGVVYLAPEETVFAAEVEKAFEKLAMGLSLLRMAGKEECGVGGGGGCGSDAKDE